MSFPAASVDFAADEALLPVGHGGERLAVRADEGGAAVVGAGGIRADAVGGEHIAGILDGAGAGERVPRETAHVGPVGHEDDGVIVVAVAQPNGEAQVVANRQQETYAAPFHDDAPVARDEALSLAAVAEEVSLVVVLEGPVRPDEEESVCASAGIGRNLQRDAAGDGGAEFRCLALHPGETGAGFLLHGRSLEGGEAGGEHFREDVQVGLRGGGEQTVEVAEVAFRVTPEDILLDEADLHGMKLIG